MEKSATSRRKKPQLAAESGAERVRPRGRPSSFRAEFVEQAKKLAGQFGAIDIEIAKFLGVDIATFYRWKHTHPDFCEALKLGKDVADDRMERSLYHRGLGYEHRAVKIFLSAKTGQPVIVPYIERFPPDSTALIFWLTNRRPDKWRRNNMPSGEDDGEGSGTRIVIRGGLPDADA